MDGFDFLHLGVAEAAPVLVYVIEEVKKFDPRCGGPTKILCSQINKQVKVHYKGKPEIKPHSLIQNRYLHDDTIKAYISEVSDLRTTIKAEWKKKLQNIVVKGIKSDFKRRTAPERFIRMRHGTPLFEAATEEANKIQNEDLNKLIHQFFWGQANEMPKSQMEDLWREICHLIPSKPELVDMGVEYFKMF